MVSLGLTQTWQFLIVLNVFLLVLGMVMDGFSAILVAVPLMIPFAARFHLQPFHLAVMFLLNLELAFLTPPLGLNLFISSFRFNRPVVSLYRIALPFVGIVAVALAIVMYVPSLSTVLISSDIRAARAQAARDHVAPREAWRLECVQEDNTHPLPCTAEDRALWAGAQPGTPSTPKPGAGAAGAAANEGEDDELVRMLGGTTGSDTKAPAPSTSGAAPSEEDELVRELMGEPRDGGS
jgi:C4-dicarboxylate transporter DctM subunit